MNEAEILAVGIGDKTHVLEKLPVRVLSAKHGGEAISYLRRWEVLSLLSRWDLPDMPDGELLERVVAAKPQVLTMALIESGNREHERASRLLGVTMVLLENTGDGYFFEAVYQLLGRPDLNELARHRAAVRKPEAVSSPENTLSLASNTLHTPSWVCQSASDRAVAKPGPNANAAPDAAMECLGNTTSLASNTLHTPSWVCQSASDRAVAKPGPNANAACDAAMECLGNTTSLASNTLHTPSWVCQSASDRTVAKPGLRTIAASGAALEIRLERQVNTK